MPSDLLKCKDGAYGPKFGFNVALKLMGVASAYLIVTLGAAYFAHSGFC